jgi:hypothetical protein
MELDTIMQIVFGISATLIAILALWFAWRTTRGKSVLTARVIPYGPHYPIVC